MHWRVYCPVRGKLAEGKTRIADYKDHAPWPEGEVAEAITRQLAGQCLDVRSAGSQPESRHL